jgi:hypothetical protein
MLTIETWLQSVSGNQSVAECPAWPPDLYAITGTLLKRSGAYLRVFERTGSSDYLDRIREIGESWRQDIDGLEQPLTRAKFGSARPAEVREAWDRLINARKTSISEISGSIALTESLIRMALIAD